MAGRNDGQPFFERPVPPSLLCSAGEDSNMKSELNFPPAAARADRSHTDQHQGDANNAGT